MPAFCQKAGIFHEEQPTFVYFLIFTPNTKTTIMKRYLPLLMALGLLFALNGTAQITYPDNFTDEIFGQDWNLPVGITFDDNGQAYVWEKGGKVHLVDTLGNRLPQPLLDISEEVCTWSDHGLLGLALHPEFLENGYIYLLYVVDRHHLLYFGTPDYDPQTTIDEGATIGRITRYTADPATGFTTLLPNSRKVLLGQTPADGFPVLMSSHGVGSLAFGDDGTLLASCGDAGSFESPDAGSNPGSFWEDGLADGIIREEENVGAFRSQMVNSHNGKIVRLDPETGNGALGNPWYDEANPRSAASRSYALGMRNPFRFSHRPETGSHFPEEGNPGTLFVGDVGSNFWEELNVVERPGANLGWPMKEGYGGLYFFDPFNPENRDAPNPLYGEGDCDREYFRMRDLFANAGLNPSFPNPCNPLEPIDGAAPTHVHHWPALIWGITYADSSVRVGWIDSTLGPQVFELEEPGSGVDGHLFEGSSSVAGFMYEGETWPEEYQGKYFHGDFLGWVRMITFDENYRVTAIDSFAHGGKSLVHLTWNPKDECMYWIDIFTSTIHRVCYGGLPRPVAVPQADTLYGASPLTVRFDGSESYSPGESPLTYEWDFGDGSTATGPDPVHEFTAPDEQPISYTVQLTVTDTAGQSRSGELIISLNNSPPQVRISSFEEGDLYPMDEPLLLRLQGEVSDAETQDEDLQYEWQLFLHHNTHFHPQLTYSEPEAEYRVAPAGCGDEAYWYRIRLQVTDPQGLQSWDEKEIFPNCGVNPEVLLSGQALEEAVELSWDSPGGWDIDRYDLRYRATGTGYSTLGQFAGGQAAYTWQHDMPSSETNYYRLRFRTSDGIWGYSNEVAIIPGLPTELFIYPNPTFGPLQVLYDAPAGGEGEWQLWDVWGRRMARGRTVFTKGRNTLQIQLPGQLPAGNYYLRLKGDAWEKEGIVQKQ